MAVLIVHAGLSYRAICETPLHAIRAVLGYLTQSGPYAPRPKPSIMDGPSIPPDQFAALFRNQQR